MQREMIIFEWKLVCVEIVANAQIDQRAEVNHLNIHMYICTSKIYENYYHHAALIILDNSFSTVNRAILHLNLSY